MEKRPSSKHSKAAPLAAALLCLAIAAGCSTLPLDGTNREAGQTLSSSNAVAPEAREDSTLAIDAAQKREHVPLSWNVEDAQLVGHQGSTAYWGSCGECCIANTMNLVTGSAYSEADIVEFVVEHGLCDTSTGGMTLDDMANAYSGLLPDEMDVHGYGGDYAPTINDMAARLENGIILNVSVYGEMMRNGGHIGEGELNGTHWIVVHSVERAADGSVAGFGIVDSASSATYLTAQELSDYYYGHDGTTIADPACVQIYGWRLAS